MYIKTVTMKPKKVVGIFIHTSFVNDGKNNGIIWPQFMPLLKTIRHRVDDNVLSIKVLNNDFSFQNRESMYEKWAATEVESFAAIPNPLSMRTLQGGDYAVFLHKGNALSAIHTFHMIFSKWLPERDLQLDVSREQFEVLSQNYHPDDEHASEEIWIPIMRIKK